MSTPVKFVVGQDNTTSDPVVEVQFPDTAPAKPGGYEFQLVVVDELGVASAPATVRLILQGTATAVVRIANVDGKPIDQTAFKLGSQIFLTAAGSSTQNGAIKSYTWKLTAQP